jgi:hypothetical protein
VPSEELGPASAHVHCKGFGAPYEAEEKTLLPRDPPDAVAASSSTASLSATDVVDETPLTETAADSDSARPVPVGPRTYPPSKPHHGSGRQSESLAKVRDELRKGVDR